MKKSFRDIFEEAGISPSYTRVRIYDYLEKEEHHPTADEIYQALVEELPTLSKTTVYNTIKLFIEKDLAKKVVLNNNEGRYELIRHEHGHFVCDKCHRIYDIPTDSLNVNLDVMPGFIVKDKDIHMKGICPSCQE